MSHRGKLSDKVRKQIESFFESGNMDPKNIAAQLIEQGVKFGTSNPVQSVAGMLTLWKRKLAGGEGGFSGPRVAKTPPSIVPQPFRDPSHDERPAFTPESLRAETEAVDPPAPRADGRDDGFNWQGRQQALPNGGFSFGSRNIEYHVRRVGPTNDGFLGTEPDGFTLQVLGMKYGSGVYLITKMVNGTKVAETQEPIASGSYGPPKFPRSGGSGSPLPRLRAMGEGAVDEDLREHGRRRSGSEDINETLSTIKSVSDALKPAPGPQDILMEKAMEAMVERSSGGGQKDGLADLIQAQVAKAEQDRRDAEAKHQQDRQAWKDEVAQRERDAETKHNREMDRLQKEFDMRQAEAKRQADEKDKRDADYRQFVEKMDRDREARYAKLNEDTQAMMGSLQQGLTEELKKDREHQEALMVLRREQLDAERKKNEEIFELQKSSLAAQTDLQRRLAGAGEDKTAELICTFLKDTMVKVDAKAGEILEAKKIEALAKIVGPENAQQIMLSFLKGGGVDITGFLGGGKRMPAAPSTPTAPGPAAPASAGDGTAVSAAPDAGAAAGGVSMNGIIAQVTGTPFFRDLLDIWAGQLRMKRKPYLFANQMAGFMVEDRRVELFYNYMASKPWNEFFSEIKDKVEPKLMAYFELPEAERFFDDVVELIAQRIEKDHVDRGIVPSSVEAPLAAPATEPAQK